uniref:Uncharacterized protein n=1 Tax=Arundo donax TaxID=35708 RepID=A0A0A9HSC7_ARUDO
MGPIFKFQTINLNQPIFLQFPFTICNQQNYNSPKQ